MAHHSRNNNSNPNSNNPNNSNPNNSNPNSINPNNSNPNFNKSNNPNFNPIRNIPNSRSNNPNPLPARSLPRAIPPHSSGVDAPGGGSLGAAAAAATAIRNESPSNPLALTDVQVAEIIAEHLVKAPTPPPPPSVSPSSYSNQKITQTPHQNHPSFLSRSLPPAPSHAPVRSLLRGMFASSASRNNAPSPVHDSLVPPLNPNTEATNAATNAAADADATAADTFSFGSVSHSLLGGEVTRNIYKWKESRDAAPARPRRNSEPSFIIHPIGIDSSDALSPVPPVLHASDLREPGVFRRHFLQTKASREGRRPPNFITRNFIDFLAMYGFYGGEFYPSEVDDDDDDDDNSLFIGSHRRLLESRIDANNETTPLLSASRASSSRSLASPPGNATTTAGATTTTTTPANSSVVGTSESKAFFMLLKAFVGTGVLFLPKAFLNGGILFSIVLMVILGYLTLHCMVLLVETSRALGNISFGDMGERLYGKPMRQLVLASIAISQMGFCCAYFIFVAQNLRDLLMIVSGCHYILPDWVFIVFQLFLYIPLAWVRRIKNFGITSLIADVFILLGLGYIFIYDLTVLGHTGMQPVSLINLESFSLFIGTAMFAFEGICLMLPISESMREPEKFSSVLTWCIITIGVIFITIGALGYMSHGDLVETVVFLNLPKTPVVSGIQFLYIVAIMLSFPLTVYPAIRITEQGLFGHVTTTGKQSVVIKWQKNVYRAVLTVVLGFVAWAGSANLDKVVSLVGCFACIPLSFIYPSLFHMHVAKTWVERVKDLGLVVFGTVAMAYTTVVTLQQWATRAPDVPLDRCHDAQGALVSLPSLFSVLMS